MSFTEKTEKLRKEAGRSVRRYGRGICAVMLCVCMVVSGFPSVFFSAFASDDDADYCYELEREPLWEALIAAVDDGTTFDKELEFYGEYADEYDELFEADGALYELKNLGYKKDRDRDKVLDLRVFARVGDDIPSDEYYEVSGDEQIIFLLENKSDETVTVTLYVDELETEVIEIVPASEVGGVIVESAFDALKTDVTVTSSEHFVASGSGRVESGSDADDAPEQIASTSLKRSNLMTAALDSSEPYDDAVAASASDALRDESASASSGSTESHISSGSDAFGEYINGDIYESVRFGSKYSAVAFVTTAEDLGLDEFGIPFLQMQTIVANIYENASYDVMAADDMEITLSGMMPLDAAVKAYPVDVEIEGLDVIAAYDIAIFDSDDAEFEPDDEIEVEMNSDEIREILGEDADLHVYHMKDIDDDPEEVSVVSSDDGIVTFMADRFSVYLLASEIMPLAEDDKTAFAVYSEDDYSLTFYYGIKPAEGDTYPEDGGKTVTNVYTGFDTESYFGEWAAQGVPWYSNRESIKSVIFDESFANVKPTSTAHWFDGFTNSRFNDIDLTNLDTSDVTDMSYMFYNCGALISLDLSNLNTSNVTNMRDMFNRCVSLTSLDVSNFATDKVTDMSNMFYGCSKLKTIYSDDSKFVTTAVTSTSGAGMFTNCTSLVGGNGTTYSSSNIDYTMAHVDEENNKGYFTAADERYGLEIYKYTGDIVYNNNDSWSDGWTPLSGAEFELRNNDGGTAWFSEETTGGKTVYTFVGWAEPTDGSDYTQTLVSGSDGMIYVDNLEAGTYYLYETKAPAGYSPLTEPIEVEISDTGTTRVNVKNNIRTLLPYTGGPGTVIFETLGVLLIGSALMLFMIQKRRKRLTE